MQQDSLADETRSPKPIATITALAGMGAFLAVMGVWFFFLRPPVFSGTVIQTPYEAPDFALTGGDGKTVHLSDYRGQVVVVFIGYTSCPDVCPTTLLQLKQAMAMLGPKSDAVQVMFLSVDPARDTPERAGKYAATFDPRFVGVTGTQEQVRDVVIAYGAYFEYIPQDNPDDYLVIHSANLYVIDREGQMAVVMPPESSAKDVAHDLRLVVNGR
jgi:protein SCO1/2